MEIGLIRFSTEVAPGVKSRDALSQAALKGREFKQALQGKSLILGGIFIPQINFQKC